jgi:hypothetical protein
MTENTDKIQILMNPAITPEQLFSFYERNDVCEKNFRMEVASRVLYHSSVIVAAFYNDELIGIARAMFDGCTADIMEFSLDLRFQGESLKYNNGSLIEKDGLGIGQNMGELLIKELIDMGATFITYYIIEDCEEAFFELLGFKENRGHLHYIIDKRPYRIERH